MTFEKAKDLVLNENSDILKAIENYAFLVKEKFEKIGYKVPNIIFRAVDGWKANSFAGPLWSNPHSTIIYIDNDALSDLAKNNEAKWFYLPHEIAHIITDEDHGGEKFEKCVADWNKAYPDKKILGDPDDEDSYNKKYLPTYYKKTSWCDKFKQPKNMSRDEFIKEFEKKLYNREWDK